MGASFAGLACATAMARRGMRTVILEKKRDVGEKLHTTGILVKDAVDQIALLDGLPADLTRRIHAVRLYAPNLRWVDLCAPGYYFLATDTPAILRWLAGQAERAGAEVRCATAYRSAEWIQSGFDLGQQGVTRYLIGADGPHSAVARSVGLAVNRQFLQGIEYEYAGASLDVPDRLHCFIDGRLALGYLGWVLSGVGQVQVGLARRVRRHSTTAAEAMRQFLEKISPIFDFRSAKPSATRGGLIPCGGVVRPVAALRVMLVGDAAGMASPLTAGGIHTALQHGMAAGHAISDYLGGKSEDPSRWFVHSYPTFRRKRWLRFAFDRFQTDFIFNALIGTRILRSAASVVYFHRQGVFGLVATQRVPSHTQPARSS